MRYITIEEQRLCEKIVKEQNIKGYSPPHSLMRNNSDSDHKKTATQQVKTKKGSGLV